MIRYEADYKEIYILPQLYMNTKQNSRCHDLLNTEEAKVEKLHSKN